MNSQKNNEIPEKAEILKNNEIPKKAEILKKMNFQKILKF